MSVAVGFKEPKNELFFSLPIGKPPFLGVVYESLDVYTLPKEFLTDEEKELFMYYSRDKINLRLQQANGSVIRFFSQLSYDRTQLLLWLDNIKNSEKIVFGVLLKKDSKQELVKYPKDQQPYFLQ